MRPKHPSPLGRIGAAPNWLARLAADCAGAADRLDHPPPGDRPGLPAAQAPRPRAGVPAVVRHRDGPSTPRPPTSGAPSPLLLDVDPVRLARSRATQLARLQPRPVRQRPVVRRLLAAGRGAWPMCSAPPAAAAATPTGARRLRDPAGDQHPGAAVPRWRRHRAPALRAARLDGRGRADRRSTTPSPTGATLATCGCASPGSVRLADALNQLHVLLPVLDESKHYWQGRRRGRQAAALRRGLAGHPPGAGADHPPLPRSPRRADPGRAGAPRRARRRGRGRRRARRGRGGPAAAEKRVPLNAPAPRRRPPGPRSSWARGR